MADEVPTEMENGTENDSPSEQTEAHLGSGNEDVKQEYVSERSGRGR